MFKELIALLQAKGLAATIADPNFANQLYSQVPTSVQNLWATNNILAGNEEDLEASEYEIWAQEASYGLAKAIAENGTASVVSKLDQKSIKTSGFKYSEVINFRETEMINIMVAMNGEGGSAALALASRSFLVNAQHLKDRLARTIEKSFWDGVHLGIMTVETAEGDTIDVVTGTVIQTPLATGAKWDMPATALPFDDFKNMSEGFEETGLEPDTIFMSQKTYNTMSKTASFKDGVTEIERSQLNQGTTLKTLGDRDLIIINQSYTPSKGAANVKYLPEGYVVMAALGDIPPVKKINLLNLDPTTDGNLASTTGEWFKTEITGKGNAKLDMQQSYKGVLAFEIPQAFVTLKTY